MSSYPKFELLYFPVRGRGEQIRLMFACAQVPFTDTNVTDWPASKASMPLGQLPVLREQTAEGETLIPQSGAITRHLARLFDMYGANEQQRTRADYLADAMTDWREKFVPIALAGMFKTDADTIAKYWNDLPATLSLFEKQLGQSSAPAAGWFVGEKVTFADVLAFEVLDGHLGLRPESLNDYPGLKAFTARFAALPGVAAYLAARRPA